MSFLTTIGNALTGGLIGQVGDVIAKTNTTDAQKLQLQIDMTKVVQDYEMKLVDSLQGAEDELTERLKADMASDSWMSKNIRPLVCAVLTIATLLLAYTTVFILPIEKTVMLKPWIEMLTMLDMTVYGFYFGSRGIEKIGTLITSAWTKVNAK